MSIGVAEDAAEDTLACEMEGVPTDSSNLAIKVTHKPSRPPDVGSPMFAIPSGRSQVLLKY